MKLLIAEDDKLSRMMLEKIFIDSEYELSIAADGDEAWRILLEPAHPHLLILDWMMPGMTGVEIVQRLRKRTDGHTYYTIILTTLDAPADISFALEGGADEFVPKPYHADALRARVNVGKRIVSLHEKLSEKMRLLEEANGIILHQAATDELTGLYNRRHFNEILSKSLSAARRHSFPLSLVMLDIDRFKSVNDTYGHSAGDKVLQLFASTILSLARTEDLIARWGGEEFILLLPHTPLEGAVVVAERIRCTLPAKTVPGISLPVTASFGVAQWNAGESAEELIKRADNALYRAKNEGRDRVSVG